MTESTDVEEMCPVMEGPHCICYDADAEFGECCYCTLGRDNCKDDEEEE